MRELETLKLIKELNVSVEATASTVARRDSNGDIKARLIRQNYADQNNMSGGIVYRVNNSTDNYLRVCNSPNAITNWLGAINRITTASNSAIIIPPSSPSNGILELQGVAFNLEELGTKNLDDLKTSGSSKHYVQSNVSYATPANNYPTQKKGILTVLSGTSLVVQTYQAVEGYSSIWTRVYNGSTWTSWSETYSTDKKPSANDIGASSSTHVHNWSAINSKPAIYTKGLGLSLCYETNNVTGDYAVGTGKGSKASGNYSFAGGNASTSEGVACFAYGTATSASGNSAHAEGSMCKATESNAHAQGSGTTASGVTSHAEGHSTTASGNYSHSQGVWTTAQGYAQTVIGTNNKIQGTDTSKDDTDSAFIIGNGSGGGIVGTPSNAFRVTWAGLTYAKGAYSSTGADYAEMFEWQDRNKNNEDRRGYFVTFEKGTDKIRKANSRDSFILGVVSSNASMIGDNYDEEWKDKYVRNEWNEIIYDKVHFEALYKDIELENGSVEKILFSEAHDEKVPRLSDSFLNDEEYIPRKDRKEWSPIGLLGKLLVHSDGTCNVGDYCMCNDDGIATKSNEGFYVMETNQKNNIIKIMIK